MYGAYVAREKASVSGHVWVGKNLVPRLICYSLFFFGILSVEVAILLVQFLFQGQTPSLAVMYLVPITSGSAALFLAEGLILWRRNKPDRTQRTTHWTKKQPENILKAFASPFDSTSKHVSIFLQLGTLGHRRLCPVFVHALLMCLAAEARIAGSLGTAAINPILCPAGFSAPTRSLWARRRLPLP